MMEDFERITDKFHVTPEEMGEVWSIYKIAHERKKYDNLDGYIGLSISNMRRDNFKKKMKKLSRHAELKENVKLKKEIQDELDEDILNNSYEDIEKKIYAQERLTNFHKLFPEYSALLERFLRGDKTTDMILESLTEKFNQMAI